MKHLIVHYSEDLSIFRFIPGNRSINELHIKRLVNSIEEHGFLIAIIIVNEKMEVIDGQHRLEAAKVANIGIFYVIARGYGVREVRAYNLNQKNWTRQQYLNSYADMGYEHYQILRDFCEDHPYFRLDQCIAICSNISSSGTFSHRLREHGRNNAREIFEEGTWQVKDMEIAELNATRIKKIEPYYSGYNRSGFVSTMLQMFNNKSFNYEEFMHKLKLQPTSLKDCVNNEQWRSLIESIYNYRRKNKVNLRYDNLDN